MSSPAASDDSRARLLRKLFALARKRGLDVDILRDRASYEGFGDSLRALNAHQLSVLIDGIEHPSRKINKQLRFRNKPAPERYALMAKLSRLLANADLDWKYADAISERMFGVRLVDWCNPDQLHSVVSALNKKVSR